MRPGFRPFSGTRATKWREKTPSLRCTRSRSDGWISPEFAVVPGVSNTLEYCTRKVAEVLPVKYEEEDEDESEDDDW